MLLQFKLFTATEIKLNFITIIVTANTTLSPSSILDNVTYFASQNKQNEMVNSSYFLITNAT